MILIPMFKVNCTTTAALAVADVLTSGMLGEGPQVQEFTNALTRLWEFPQVTCLNSCTSALTLAVRLAVGDNGGVVLSTPFTMPATNCAIRAAGGVIRWGKVDSSTWCLDLDDAMTQIRDGDIDAVVVTLVGGNIPHGLEDFLEEANRQDVKVIFDAAHALMTTYKGKHISHWADYCCFSFQSIKHLTTGDGGAITCLNKQDYRRAEKMKWFGMSREVPPGMDRLTHQMTYSIPEWGYKFHMNDISAAIGLANIQVALEAVDVARRNADLYTKLLPSSVLVEVPEGCSPSWWVYPISLSSEELPVIQEALLLNGIASTPMWPLHGIHRDFADAPSQWPSSHPRPLFIPNGFWVTENDVQRIAQTIKGAFQLCQE